jgi:HlyD family secretion protein
MNKKNFQKKIIIPLLIILIFGGYFGYRAMKNKNKETRYVLTSVQKGTIVVSVSGSGQISAQDQIDIKPKVSGEIAGIFVKEGQEIKAGKLIAKLDDTDFQKAVRDAQTSLEIAKLELDKLLEPVDELTLLQAENSLAQAKEAKQKAEDNLEKAYEDGFNTVSNAFLDLPTIMAGLNEILFGHAFNKYQDNINCYADAVRNYDSKVDIFKDNAYNTYQTARKQYDQNFADYKSTSRYSEKNVIESLINQSYETTKAIAEAIKSANNLIQFYKDKLTERGLKPDSLADTHLSLLNTYTGKTNNHLLNLLSIKQTIEDSKDAITNAERSIEEREKSLAKLKAGPDELDIKAKKIAVQQKEDNLKTAKENLAKCSIYAPFDGVISDIKVKKGDTVSSGTVLATLITKQKIAEITLNEIDAAKVKVDQRTTLTFDALPDLTLTGKVTEIDTVGTVSQGVTSYGVKISLDTDDERIKPGMSVNAEIVVEAKPDVLTLPNSAIKSEGNLRYVQLIDAPEEIKKKLKIGTAVVLPKEVKIKNQPVEVGISNETMTEILSGVSEGDIVISSKVTQQTQTTQTRSMFQFPGMTPQRR